MGASMPNALYASHMKLVHGNPHLSIAKVRIRMLRRTRFKRDAYYG